MHGHHPDDGPQIPVCPRPSPRPPLLPRLNEAPTLVV